MNSIPIFDSLTHPTIDGNWILPRFSNKSNIDDLLCQMQTNNVCAAFAVGMDAIGAYSEARYSDFILSKTDKLLPIAFFNVNEAVGLPSVTKKIKLLKGLKYRGIKLHPRKGQFNLLHELLPTIIKAANDENLTVLLCTYFYENGENAVFNNIENLLKLLVKVPNEKIILLHSGSVRLLEMMEIARAFENVLLDLSFTISKYTNSSLDFDIKHMFNVFDKRICMGSDFPNYSLTEMRSRFNFFAKNISQEKASNIAFRNISKFLEL